VLLPVTTDDWRRLLCEVGCQQEIAEARAPIFAAGIHEGTFSAGLERELPDFLTTILHESSYLERLKESGKYSARRIREIAGKAPIGSRWAALYKRADELAGNERAFFEALYSGRFGNGPEGSGDGALYPGRAYLGMTFKDNYAWVGDAVGQDLVGVPTLAEGPWFALDFTIAWWEGKVPDHVLGDERKVRKVVNGGYIGIEEVERLAKLVRGALQC
jgi:putative chitinase